MLQCGAYSRFTFCSITATVATMSCYKNNSARMAPAAEPLPEDIQHAIDAIMRGRPPLSLFTTLARDRRLFFKFFNSGLLDRGHLTIRQREIVIDRVTAACGAEYEWGVHVSVFATKAGLTEAQIMSLTMGGSDDTCWTDADRVLIRLCDSLHDDCTGGRRALGRAHRTPFGRGNAGTAHARGHVPHDQLPGELTAVGAGTRSPTVPAVASKLRHNLAAAKPPRRVCSGGCSHC